MAKPLGTILGVALCGALSAATAILFSSRNFRVFIPLVFVAVIVALAKWLGPAVGIYGSFVAALIFAVMMLEPFHSLRIQNAVARANIGWMLLAGITLSYLLARPPRTPHKRN